MGLKENFVQALSDSINDVFKNVFYLSPVIKEGASGIRSSRLGRSIVASIGMAGKVEGSLVIIFSDLDARKAVSKIIGFEMEEMSQDVFDGIGETANILAGGFKTRVAKDGYDCEISLPSVILADNPVIVKSEHENTIEIYGECPEIRFELVFSYVIGAKHGRIIKDAVTEEMARQAEKSLKDLIKKESKNAS